MIDTRKIEMLYEHLKQKDIEFYTKTLAEEIKDEITHLRCEASDKRVSLRIDANIKLTLYCMLNHGVRIVPTVDNQRMDDIESSRSTVMADLEKFLLKEPTLR